MSLPFLSLTAAGLEPVERAPRADGAPVAVSPPPGAATGRHRRRFQEDYSDQAFRDDFFPDLPRDDDFDAAGVGDLALVACFVVVAVLASAIIGAGIGYLAALV